MINLKSREFAAHAIYYIMSEQPNCCPVCQSRLDIIETVLIEHDEIQVNFCDKCNIEVLMINEEVESRKI